MIAYLKGKILNKDEGFVIVDVHDVGYKVFVSLGFYVDINPGQEVEFFIHQHVREDALSLYGFRTLDELKMFELLISISGIGPKSALGVLAIASVNDIKETIASGDPSLLIKVSGIGKKTAERVVLELRGKVGVLLSEKTAMSINSDEIDALVALGYSLQQARDALKKVDPSIKDSGARIREALKGI